MRKCIHVLAALSVLTMVSCNQRVMTQTPQLAVDMGLVSDALSARLRSAGGCGEEIEINVLNIEAFEDVSFWLGTCVREHGQTGEAVVGLDSTGVLYLPVSEAAFRFLVMRNPPESSSLRNELEYASLALRLMGVVDWSATLVTSPDELPEDVRSSIAAAGHSIGSRAQEGMPALVTMQTEYSVDQISLILHSSGLISIIHLAELWSHLD